MGWNVKHPTKWVSYRSLHEAFWVSLALEGWLKWFHGFSIFFGWKVRGFVGLPGGGSRMIFWGCVCHSQVMPWAPVRETTLQGSQRKHCQTVLDRGGPFDSEPLGATELLQEREDCGEGITYVRASERSCILAGDAEQLMARATHFLVHKGESLCNPIHSLCCICKWRIFFSWLEKWRKKKKRTDTKPYSGLSIPCNISSPSLGTRQCDQGHLECSGCLLDVYVAPLFWVLSLGPRAVQSAQRVWLWASCHLAPSLTSLAETHLQSSWNPDSRALAAQYQGCSQHPAACGRIGQLRQGFVAVPEKEQIKSLVFVTNENPEPAFTNIMASSCSTRGRRCCRTN